MNQPLSFNREPSELLMDGKRRHEEFVDLFGQFLFWIRNWSLHTATTLVESEEAREKLGTIRRKYYDSIAKMAPDEKDAAFLFVEGTLDGFLERFIWSLGNEGTDARFGERHAYRFEIKMEIVDVQSGKIVHTESINRGGKFFGSYWGRWLNRYRAK
jgi:hypothetical protein